MYQQNKENVLADKENVYMYQQIKGNLPAEQVNVPAE
jgi:hypothetical protein